MTNTDVFISYAWDSEEHKDKVMGFANYLRGQGYKVDIDRFLSQEHSATDFGKLMHKGIADYGKVIVVLSKKYKEKGENFEGGAGKEFGYIINDIDKSHNKYILVTLEKRSDGITPFGFKGRDVVEISDIKSFEPLYYKLNDVPEYVPAAVGAAKPVVVTKTVASFWDKPASVIEILDVKVTQGETSIVGNKIKYVENNLEIEIKNASSASISSMELVMEIDERFLNKYGAGNGSTNQSFMINEPLFPGRKKPLQAIPIYISHKNAHLVADAEVKFTIYTENGSAEKAFKLLDICKCYIQNLGVPGVNFDIDDFLDKNSMF